MSIVVDYYGPHGRAFMDCLAESGVVGIARYLTNSPRDPRQITPQEVADAHAAGLAVHFVYEMNPTYPGYFTFAQGAEDCRQSVARLRELGAPAGTVVYFAVDTNIEPSIAVPYFNGVESMRTPDLTPGIYGFERMVHFARANFPNVGKHLWQTYGTPRAPLDLWQHEQRALCGVAVDINECAASGWRKEDEMDRNIFNAWFLENYRAYRVAETFDDLKEIQRQFAEMLRAFQAGEAVDDAEVAKLKERIDRIAIAAQP